MRSIVCMLSARNGTTLGNEDVIGRYDGTLANFSFMTSLFRLLSPRVGQSDCHTIPQLTDIFRFW